MLDRLFASTQIPQQDTEVVVGACEVRISAQGALVREDRPWGVALRRPPWKLIWWEHGARELYDLSRDPGETRNLAAEHSDVAARLQAQLEDEVISKIGSAEFQRSFGKEPDEKTLEILRSLGYVE